MELFWNCYNAALSYLSPQCTLQNMSLIASWTSLLSCKASNGPVYELFLFTIILQLFFYWRLNWWAYEPPKCHWHVVTSRCIAVPQVALSRCPVKVVLLRPHTPVPSTPFTNHLLTALSLSLCYCLICTTHTHRLTFIIFITCPHFFMMTELLIIIITVTCTIVIISMKMR